MMRYEHIIGEMTRQPWAIMREKLETIMGVVNRGVLGVKLTVDEIQALVGGAQVEAASRANKVASVPKSVKVIPVYGVLAPRGSQLNSSGVTSAEALAKEIREAAASPYVSEIVLDVDSPGGSVAGIAEAGHAVNDAKAEKPVYAIANHLMASAAYWIGAQATELWMAPDALVGSIGVYSMHVDYSEALAKEGIKVTYLSAGKHKVDGNDAEPLSDQARADMQGLVDEYYSRFVAAVASGRGVPAATVRGGMGQGRVVMAKEAKAENMVDKVGTFDALLGKLGVSRTSGAQAARTAVDVNAEKRELELQELGVQIPLKSETTGEAPEGAEPDDTKNNKEIVE